MMKKKICILTIIPFVLCLFIAGCGLQSDKISQKNNTDNKADDISGSLTISAAASLQESMVDIEKEFKSSYPNISLSFNFGASGSLEQQIEQGAPADIFISAGQSQMKALEAKDLLLKDSNKDLVKNDLVLIGPKDTTITTISNLNSDKIKKIAIGEPNSVPAGKYADEALTKLGIKASIESKLVFAKDVKEVLAWTTSGNADIGFVYLSDALNNDSIKIIETVKDDLHSPIIYPVAIIKSTKNEIASKKFEGFLFTDKAKNIFSKYGYKIN